MADLPVSNGATLTHSTIAVGDIFPLVDISASTGSKGSKITLGELAASVFAIGASVASVFSVNGAASTPAIALTGSIFSGGTSTTTKPLFLIEPVGTLSTGWNTNGTLFGLNAPSGFGGNLIGLQKAGTPLLSITNTGRLSWGIVASFDRKPILFAEGPYAQVEWLQSGDGAVTTNAPMCVDAYILLHKNGSADGTYLFLDDSNILGQRYGTSAQTSRIYETYTDASNYARLAFNTSGGSYSIKPEAAGTGTLRDLSLGASGGRTLIQSSMLQLGGTTSSYPSLATESGVLQVLLADGSGYAPLDAEGYSVGGTRGASGSATAAHTLTIVNGIVTNIS